METLEITYFSDVLCVWAYAGQVRIDEVKAQFGARVLLVNRFLNVYGDVPRRIQKHTGDADDPNQAYAEKMRGVAARFDHTRMHDDAFARVRPRSSNQAHLVLCALRCYAAARFAPSEASELMHDAVKRVRVAFFEEGRDVGEFDTLYALLEAQGVDIDALRRHIRDGSAMAELSHDFMLKDDFKIVGSPTYVLDGGREKLFGNVGYRVIEANVSELLDAQREPSGATWC